MIVEIIDNKLTYRCDSCLTVKIVNASKRNTSKTMHMCRTCNAKKQARLGGLATKAKYGPEHYRQLGEKLMDWCISEGFASSRKGGLRSAELGIPSKAGKIGGRRTVESGKLAEISKFHAHADSAEAKRFRTRKERGLMSTSTPELHLLEILMKEFGESDVEHHITVGRFSIDFLIKSLNVYVQLDGEYWHGLTGEYDQLNEIQRSKFDRDRACDAYCISQGIKLIRITDKELKMLGDDSVIKKIRS